MPTQETLDKNVAEFERQYPEDLPDRIKWWAYYLDIDRGRLFRLLGLSDRDAARTPLSALPEVVAAHEDRAELVDNMLGELLASSDYDLRAFSAYVHNAVGPATAETGRPGGDVPLPYTPGPRARQGILLNLIVAGGPFSLRALVTYLGEARTGAERRSGEPTENGHSTRE